MKSIILMLLAAQNIKNVEHALEVCEMSPGNKSNFRTLQKEVQVADGEGCNKRYKTFLISMVLMFLEAQFLQKQ